jgi:hypothetical protein
MAQSTQLPSQPQRAPVAQHRIATVHHRVVHPRVADAIAPGDIVVHGHQRSFLDPGPPAWNESGTGARYATDSTPDSPLSYRETGSEFGLGGFETLPTRFNPPGRPEPLFEW